MASDAEIDAIHGKSRRTEALAAELLHALTSIRPIEREIACDALRLVFYIQLICPRRRQPALLAKAGGADEGGCARGPRKQGEAQEQMSSHRGVDIQRCAVDILVRLRYQLTWLHPTTREVHSLLPDITARGGPRGTLERDFWHIA